MEYERTGFVEAVESLARTAGVEVPRVETPQNTHRDQHRKKCYEILEKAASYYEEQLKHHHQRHPAVKYLQNRGLSGQIAKIYGLGFAAPGWDNLILKLGSNEHTLKLLSDTGLSIEKPEENKRYDRFRNRIMFPIRDGRGRVIGFGGRVLGDDKPKYLNSPETDVFSKGRELYGLYEAKQNNRNLEQLIVVEGYMDVIALAQYGLWNAVATLGTACGEEHLKIAFRQVKEVVFCFDGDNAGRNAAKRALLNSLSSMEDGRQIRFLFLPEGQDPDSLVRQIGADRFKAQIHNAVPLEEFLFEFAAEGINLNSMDGRARFSKVAAPLINQLSEGVFRSLMLDNLAKRTGLDLETLKNFTQLPSELQTELSATEESAEQEPGPREETSEKKAQSLALATHKPRVLNSTLSLSPARNATLLLLDHPELLNQCSKELALNAEPLNEDEKNLSDLIDYLKKRPEANFNNIMGYWGGSKGVEAQQSLANLMANHVLLEVKHVDAYNAKIELEACLKVLNDRNRAQSNKDELASLQAKGLTNLSAHEKRRYTQLIQSL